jgi:hypothetical protein
MHNITAIEPKVCRYSRRCDWLNTCADTTYGPTVVNASSTEFVQGRRSIENFQDEEGRTDPTVAQQIRTYRRLGS